MTAQPPGAAGYIEVTSYVAAILASDAMVKAASVTLEAVHKPTGGLVCVHARGSLADCQAAIAAGAAEARARGALVGSLVLGRPAEDTAEIWTRHIPAMRARKSPGGKGKSPDGKGKPPDGGDGAGTTDSGGPGARSGAGRKKTGKGGKT